MEAGVPRAGNARSPVAIIDAENVTSAGVFQREVREGRIICVAIQGCLLFGLNVLQALDDGVVVVVIGDQRLLVVQFMWSCLPAVRQAVGEGKGRLQAPRVLEEEVVGVQRRLGDQRSA